MSFVSTMSSRELDSWKQQRESGKWYIAVKTAISFGAAMFLLEAILYWAYPANHIEFPFLRVFDGFTRLVVKRGEIQ